MIPPLLSLLHQLQPGGRLLLGDERFSRGIRGATHERIYASPRSRILAACSSCSAVALATQSHSSFANGIAWTLLGGLSGGGALAIFYRALATGRMGLTAPVAAVLGAAIPTVFGMFREGLPQAAQVAGFLLAEQESG